MISPNLEAVLINGNRNSVIEIVQSVSRCLRIHPDKEYGRILIPCLIETDDIDGPGEFPALRKFISSMGSIDEALVQEIVECRGKGGRKIVVNDVFTKGIVIGEDLVMKNFEVRMYDRILNGRNFSSEYKFRMLVEFCKEHNILPQRKEEYNNIKIGIFLYKMLKRGHKNHQDRWIEKMMNMSEIRDEIQVRIDRYR